MSPWVSLVITISNFTSTGSLVVSDPLSGPSIRRDHGNLYCTRTVAEVELKTGGLDTLLYKHNKSGESNTIKQHRRDRSILYYTPDPFDTSELLFRIPTEFRLGESIDVFW